LDDHDLLTRLKSEIAPDLATVQPLPAPGLRALWLLAAWVVLAGGLFMVLGSRQDVEVLGPWRSVGFSLVEVAFCLGLFRIGLRFSIPAMAGSLSTALVWVAGALLVHIVVNWATLERSALSPPAGHEWRTALACLSAITLLSLAPLALGFVLLSRGLLTRLLPVIVLTGVASGLAAESLWRLHCPYSNWSHVLLSHSGALVVPVLVASAAAMWVRHRR
jgi:hypothetical protein